MKKNLFGKKTLSIILAAALLLTGAAVGVMAKSTTLTMDFDSSKPYYTGNYNGQNAGTYSNRTCYGTTAVTMSATGGDSAGYMELKYTGNNPDRPAAFRLFNEANDTAPSGGTSYYRVSVRLRIVQLASGAKLHFLMGSRNWATINYTQSPLAGTNTNNKPFDKGYIALPKTTTAETAYKNYTLVTNDKDFLNGWHLVLIPEKLGTASGDCVQIDSVTVEELSDSEVQHVTLEANGGTAPAALNGYIGDSGATYSMPTATKKGATFAGWYTDADCTDGNEFDLATYTFATGAKTLYAKYEGDDTDLSAKEYVVGDPIYHTDFESDTVGQNAAGWEIASVWGWTGTGYSAKVEEYSTYGKALKLSSSNCAAWACMPTIPARNYSYRATVVPVSGSRFGIDCCMYNRLSANNGGAVEAKINIGADGYFSTSGVGNYPKFSDTDFTMPTAANIGQAVELELINCNNVCTLYVNGEKAGSVNVPDYTSETDGCGFYLGNAAIYVTEVTVSSIETAQITAGKPDLYLSGTADEPVVGVGADFTWEKSNFFYREYVKGDYTAAAGAKLGYVTAVTSNADKTEITRMTKDATVAMVEDFTQDSDAVHFTVKKDALTAAELDKYVVIRPFLLIGSDYYYGRAVSGKPVKLASGIYADMNTSAATRIHLSTAFAGVDGFSDEEPRQVTFSMFADFHYDERTIAGIPDLRAVLKRADENNVDFVLSLGDMIVGIADRPEFVKAFKDNPYGLKVYNVYGNHELECAGATMELVTPSLTNDPDVVWGTADGKMDTSIGYYYFDINGFRFICLDTNYYVDGDGQYRHNNANSYGPPSTAKIYNALGPVQFAWAEKLIMDAADKGLSCVVCHHAGIDGVITGSVPEGAALREVFKKANDQRPGTVLMSICGHEHWDRQVYVDGVLYKYVNVVRGCCGDRDLQGTPNIPYAGLTYEKEYYDADGNYLRTETKSIQSCQSNFSFYSADPMSTIITINSNGIITMDGTESTWLNNEAPTKSFPGGTGPRHESGVFCDSEMLFGKVVDTIPGITQAGDVNNDSKIDSDDLTALAQHVAKIADVPNPAAADVTFDGKVDSDDLTELAKYVAKIISSFDPPTDN